jgi:phosphatidate cytidylyltransferase
MTDQPSPPPTRSGDATALWRDLGVRALAALTMIPVALAAVWAGGAWFQLLLAAGGVVMAYEWCRMVHGGSPLQLALHGSAALLAAALPLAMAASHWLLAGLGLLWLVSLALAWRNGEKGSGWALAGLPYVALPVLALGLLRLGEAGFAAVLWVMLAVWAADTGAYFAGRTIGGPKLAPRISPKKTWAGLAGAIGGAMLAGLAVWLAFGLARPAMALVLGGLLGLVEQLGDLFESAAKRHFGLKDSGHLIPGHGGLLDRVDGLVAASLTAGLIGVLRAGADAPAIGLLSW